MTPLQAKFKTKHRLNILKIYAHNPGCPREDFMTPLPFLLPTWSLVFHGLLKKDLVM